VEKHTHSAVDSNIDSILADVGKYVFMHGIAEPVYPLTNNYFVSAAGRVVVGTAYVAASTEGLRRLKRNA